MERYGLSVRLAFKGINMVKRTVPELAEFLAEATGLPDSSLRSISRRLREAGLLSQHGHGRGAAAATAEDAATLLLVAMTEFPPLHAALVGQALRACTPVQAYLDEIGPHASHEGAMGQWRPAAASVGDEDIPKDPILLTAFLIERRDLIDVIIIGLKAGINVQFVKTESDPRGIESRSVVDYELPSAASVQDEFRQKLGGREKSLSRRHYISGQALLDIADWLKAAADA